MARQLSYWLNITLSIGISEFSTSLPSHSSFQPAMKWEEGQIYLCKKYCHLQYICSRSLCSLYMYRELISLWCVQIQWSSGNVENRVSMVWIPDYYLSLYFYIQFFKAIPLDFWLTIMILGLWIITITMWPYIMMVHDHIQYWRLSFDYFWKLVAPQNV